LLEALSAHKTHHAKLLIEGMIKAFPYLKAQLDDLMDIADLHTTPKTLYSNNSPEFKKEAI
jgi:hypothetical protein